MILADLGGRRLKLAVLCPDGSLRVICEQPWSDQPSLADRQLLVQLLHEHGGPLWLSSTRPRALPSLRAVAEIEDALRVVAPSEVPIERETTGTGSDRLLAALAASRQAQGACLIADLGTAWTLDVVDEQARFRGGAIGPGWGVQVQALAQACPHLDAPAHDDPDAIPRSTAAAVRAGTQTALAASIQGLAAQWQAEVGPARCFLTGGDAASFAALLGPSWESAENLVLQGLAILAQESGA